MDAKGLAWPYRTLPVIAINMSEVSNMDDNEMGRARLVDPGSLKDLFYDHWFCIFA